ncbi:MAG: hypothetical protein M3Y22_02745, partial [Pseudomonadota bacterium]|nr:hypothetical protein [Pseudomonadota bacterium]
MPDPLAWFYSATLAWIQTAVDTQATFHMNWHLEVLAAKLDAVRRGAIRRLIVNIAAAPEVAVRFGGPARLVSRARPRGPGAVCQLCP